MLIYEKKFNYNYMTMNYQHGNKLTATFKLSQDKIKSVTFGMFSEAITSLKKQ